MMKFIYVYSLVVINIKHIFIDALIFGRNYYFCISLLNCLELVKLISFFFLITNIRFFCSVALKNKHRWSKISFINIIRINLRINVSISDFVATVYNYSFIFFRKNWTPMLYIVFESLCVDRSNNEVFQIFLQHV